MKIHFDKIGSLTKDFNYSDDGVSFIGTLNKLSYHRVSLEGKLSGSIDIDCARCAESIKYILDSNLKFTISDEFIKTTNNLNIIEFLDGVIDIKYIVDSEINSIKISYIYCEKCSNSDKEFELEF